MPIAIPWPRVQLGEDERDAHLVAVLVDDTAALDWRTSGNGDAIRFEFDCQDSFFGRPPTGDVTLYVYALRAPTEVRGHERDYRALDVAWFWETDADESRIRVLIRRPGRSDRRFACCTRWTPPTPRWCGMPSRGCDSMGTGSAPAR